MTQQSSDMVERIARALFALDAPNGDPEEPVFNPHGDLQKPKWKLYERQAFAVLEACHHAELVEALERAAAATRTLARNILDDVGPGACDGWVGALNTISRNIEADLAKIGGAS
jgi:hypothetical protein